MAARYAHDKQVSGDRRTAYAIGQVLKKIELLKKNCFESLDTKDYSEVEAFGKRFQELGSKYGFDS
jgi:hypothetical protein